MRFEIWIKRRFWFGYTKIVAENYKTETVGNTARLSLVLSDGCRLAIPNIDRKLVKVYPIHKPQLEDSME